MNLAEIADEVIANRRAIYTGMFDGTEVDDEIINKMLENANWAPTHKLTEPWRFVVFKGNGRMKLADFQSELYKEKAMKQGTFDDSKFQKLKRRPMECSHVIAIGMKRDDKQRVPEVEEICATACAVQNMWITASAHKIGCYWSTGGVTFYPEAKSFFGLGEEDKLLGFLFIGNTKTEKWPEGKRAPIEEKITWVE